MGSLLWWLREMGGTTSKPGLPGLDPVTSVTWIVLAGTLVMCFKDVFNCSYRVPKY